MLIHALEWRGRM